MCRRRLLYAHTIYSTPKHARFSFKPKMFLCNIGILSSIYKYSLFIIYYLRTINAGNFSLQVATIFPCSLLFFNKFIVFVQRIWNTLFYLVIIIHRIGSSVCLTEEVCYDEIFSSSRNFFLFYYSMLHSHIYD